MIELYSERITIRSNIELKDKNIVFSDSKGEIYIK